MAANVRIAVARPQGGLLGARSPEGTIACIASGVTEGRVAESRRAKRVEPQCIVLRRAPALSLLATGCLKHDIRAPPSIDFLGTTVSIGSDVEHQFCARHRGRRLLGLNAFPMPHLFLNEVIH